MPRALVWVGTWLLSALITLGVLTVVVVLALMFPWVFFIAIAAICGVLIWRFS